MSEGSNICNHFGHCQYSYERFQTLLWVLETNGEARSMTIKESSTFMECPMASWMICLTMGHSWRTCLV